MDNHNPNRFSEKQLLASQRTKRKAIKMLAGATVPTVLAYVNANGSVWIEPVIKTVTLPAHAQTSVVLAPSGPPSTTGLIRVTSILWRQTASADPTLLVDEHVDIQNVDSIAIDIQNWTLRDVAGATLTFPQRVLQPGESCRIYVHAAPGLQACEFSFGRTRPDLSFSYIFNNTGDTAFLADSSGAVVDTCSYTGGDSSPYSCP